MENPYLRHPLKLLITILDRGRGSKAVDFFRARQLHFDFVCLGMGTANSEILDTLGLGEIKKDVVLTLAPKVRVPGLLRELEERLQLTGPGRGIVFSIPLSSASRQIPQVLCKPEYLREEREVEVVESSSRYNLIISIHNRGFTDQVMDAAKKAGARGGTILHARRVGYEDAENFLGFTLQPEKEILAILVQCIAKQSIMEAINRVAGLTTECQGILFSLPVEDLSGLHFSEGAALEE